MTFICGSPSPLQEKMPEGPIRVARMQEHSRFQTNVDYARARYALRKTTRLKGMSMREIRETILSYCISGCQA